MKKDKKQKTLWKIFFSIKSTKTCKENQGRNFSVFARMMSLLSNWKLCNLMTSWRLTKTSQNFFQGSFSVKQEWRFCIECSLRETSKIENPWIYSWYKHSLQKKYKSKVTFLISELVYSQIFQVDGVNIK